LAQAKILVIDDEPDIGWLFSKILSEEGYEVLISLNGEEGISKIKKEQPDLVFLDLKLPGKGGIEILREIRRSDKDLLVIVLTAYETVKTAVEAMKLGAYDYLSKPINIEKIKTTLKNALRTQELIKVASIRQKKAAQIEPDHIVGNSHQIQEVLNLVKTAAPHDITVLLRGASGTGKELIARAIHDRSPRAEKPFVPIDCGILPDTLVESEIFGHEKGAFTGATDRKLGKFELAQEGTVFLDEIGNLTPQIQVKLLRSLQEREIERLGGKKPIRVDVRVIAATNVNLEKAITAGRFREDLYFRINVFSITLPLLRERNGDIVLLAEYFLEKFNRIFKKNVKKISPDAIKLLTEYPWPGNVRELRNVIESAVLLTENKILPRHMPLKIQEAKDQDFELPTSLKKVGNLAKRKAEKELIIKVLKEVKWNKNKASKILKVDYKTLYNKIKEYNIDKI
jgi:DNA-binding NtrC family response regulator